MPVELITYGTDRRMVLSNGEAIRAPVYLDDWTTIRIGLAGAFTGFTGSLAGTPRFAFGVRSGDTNGYGAALSDNVLGFRSGQASLTYAAGPPATVNPFASSGRFFTKIGATITDAAAGGGGNGFFSADSTVRSYVAMEITKGSPNFSLSLVSVHVSGTISTDVTEALFLTYMESGALAPGGTYTTYGPTTMAVDETTDGVLDHLFFYWDRTSQQFGFDVKHRKIA